MTGTSEIITQAYRESNLIAIGKEPTVAMQTEALARLNTLVSGVLGREVGEAMAQWPVGEGNPFNWHKPPANVTLLYTAATTTDIVFPENPYDGARMAFVDFNGLLTASPVTIDGNGRWVENGAEHLLDTANTSRSWLYRADLGKWARVENLDIDSEMPYPLEFDDVFITKLAMRLNPRYGRSIDEQTVATMNSALSALQARYRQKRGVAAPNGVLAIGLNHRGGYVDPYSGEDL